jgi:hypothetical protein
MEQQMQAVEPLEYDTSRGKTAMQVEATKKLFTVDDYYRMADVGIPSGLVTAKSAVATCRAGL